MSEGLMLLVTLVIANFSSVFLAVISVGHGTSIKERLKSLFILDTSEGLIKQGLLWLSIATPILNGLALGGWAWLGHSVNLSAQGFENFFKISLLPIGIMSVSLPLAGLISRIHSTQQAARQIAQAENQIKINKLKSNIDAFYAHRKGLTEYLGSIDDLTYFKLITFTFKTHPVLHKRFFNGSPEDGWPSVNTENFDYIRGKIIQAARFLRSVLDGETSGTVHPADRYLNSCTDIVRAAKLLAIKQIYHGLVLKGISVRPQNGVELVTVGVTTLEALAALRFVREFFNNLCDYAGVERMVIPTELECMFSKTERYARDRKVEYLHAVNIQELISSGVASANEDHPNYAG